jgi:hypothetical protein
LIYDLPDQLKWDKFCALLRRLGYGKPKSYGGSARNFTIKAGAKKHPKVPELLTVHEPHGSDPIRPGTLRSYIEKLNLGHNEFLDLLYGSTAAASADGETEERFRHTLDQDGLTISNCLKCFEPVAKSLNVEEVVAAEAAHQCAVPA